MRVTLIASPAKRMREQDAEPRPRRLPELVGRAERLADALRSLTRDEAQALWRCSDALADLNYERVRRLDVRRATTAAAVAYEGIQYTSLAATVMTGRQLDWLDDHLRILSGLYGVLRPLDAVVPYRLEMQARLSADGARDLYEFWGPTLYESVAATSDLIVNVASVEYSRAVTPWVRADGPQVLTCLFGTVRDGRLRQAATEAKAARGTFVRWCAEREVSEAEQLRAFSERGYSLEEGRSDDATLVFVRP